MKKLLSIFTLTLLLLSCRSEEEKLKDKLLPVLKSSALKDSLVTHIDSLIIYKIDTLTTLKDSLSKINTLTMHMDFETSLRKDKIEMAEMETASAKLSFNQARLYKDTFGNGVLVDSKIDEGNDHIKKAKSYLIEGRGHSSQYQKYLARVDNILKMAKDKRLDSTDFKGYIVRFRLKGSDNNNRAVKKDSLSNMVNPDFRIIGYGDINRK